MSVAVSESDPPVSVVLGLRKVRPPANSGPSSAATPEVPAKTAVSPGVQAANSSPFHQAGVVEFQTPEPPVPEGFPAWKPLGANSTEAAFALLAPTQNAPATVTAEEKKWRDDRILRFRLGFRPGRSESAAPRARRIPLGFWKIGRDFFFSGME